MARCRYCNGCKALYISKNHATCELGFKIRRIDSKRIFMGSLIDTMTLYADKDCPKPRTYKAMIEFCDKRGNVSIMRNGDVFMDQK